ncbi:MAG: hypothetical protein QOD45_1889 [Pseudonocardiales bacterium]|nr:hypothetical protein [Pseudonocardiales bacterium]
MRIRTGIAVAVGGLTLTACAGGLVGSGEHRAPSPTASPIVGSAQSGAVGAPDAPQRAVPAMPPLADPAAVIRTVDLAVRLAHRDDLGRQADRAGAIATTADGSVFADDRRAGSQPTARLVLKVPPTRLTAVLAQLAEMGVEQSRQLSTVDVTSKVADVNARVTSARASIARLQALYGQAVKVSDVIAIETELATRQADLESLEAQQRALTAETTYATITLTLTTPAQAGAQPRRGFVGGLLAGWRHFLDGAQAVATAIGAAIPFAALLALLVGPLWLLRRRHVSRPNPGAAAPEA